MAASEGTHQNGTWLGIPAARMPSSRVSRVYALSIFVLVMSAYVAGRAAASDVIVSCENCPVGTHERAGLARWLRAYDVVFEGTCVGADSVPIGYDRGRPRVSFRISRLLRGIALARELEMVVIGWRDVPAQGTPVLAWILRGCTADGHPCGNFVRVTPERTMLFGRVSSDWRRESSHLSCDSLERDIIQEPDSTGLEAFEQVTALALAHLEIQDPFNPPLKDRLSGGFPDNGGTWPLEGIRWILGRSSNVPHFVRFPQVRWKEVATGVHDGDRFLLPMHEGDRGDTLIVKTSWRPMLVRNGEAVGFGVPVDSLPALYARHAQEYELRVPGAP